MANIGILGELPDEAFNPHPEYANRPVIMVRLGIFVASAAVAAALSSPPNVGLFGNEHAPYVFYISLAVLLLFGIGLIVLGWYVADGNGDYNVVTRTALRASQIVLVFAVGLYEVNSNS